MNRSRLSTPRDYLALMVRRKWIILFTFLGCLGLALLTVSVIPNIYVSEALILFQPGDVSTDFVKEITNGTTDERVTAIQETILSRSNLGRIVKEFESGLSSFRELSEDRKIDRMRNQLEIEFLSEKVRNIQAPVTHVRIRYRERSPELARKVAARLASLFIEKENQTREDQVYGTTKFLNGELSKVAERLNESGERLKVIKERYKDQLPAQLEANLRTLDRLQQQKTANAEALDRQRALQLTLEQQLSQTPQRIPSEFAGPANNIRARNPLVDKYLQKQTEYKDLLAKATNKHPDAIRLKSELDQLRKLIPPEDFDSIGQPDLVPARAKTDFNPLYQSLSAQLTQVKTEIEIRKREKSSIEAQISESMRRVENTPTAEQEVGAVERNTADLAKQADDLRAKLDQAKLAETLEVRQQTAQFVLVDPANLPLDPAAPNRMALQLAGIGMSLALGLFAGTLADLSRRRVFTSIEVERLLSAPVLIEIPRMNPAWNSMRRRRLRLKYAAIVLLAGCLYGWGLYYLYSHPDSLLRMLDPFLQTGAPNAQK